MTNSDTDESKRSASFVRSTTEVGKVRGHLSAECGGRRGWLRGALPTFTHGLVSGVFTIFRGGKVWSLVLLLLAYCQTWQSGAAPAVIITNLPSYGSFNTLSGVVSGAGGTTNAVAVFIYVPGYGWVTKPTCAQPLTPIQADGSWVAEITTGGSDQLATRVAALLVNTNYNQPCVDGSAYLPTNLFAQARAAAVVTRPSPGIRFVNFSGYDWWLKSSTTVVGPGPNYFSDSTNNVWVDTAGQLHARITNRSNQWQCAELVSARTFGYGAYRFELASSVDAINLNVVLGLFTWSDDPVFADREIDIECSRWGSAADPNNAQFVVQPYNLSGHLARYPTPASDSSSAHLFTWQTNGVAFQSQHGSAMANPPPAKTITNWSYSMDTPRTGDENVRINLWLMNGSAPTDHNEHEFVIKSFRFVPPGSVSAPRLTNLNRTAAGVFGANVQTEMDRAYEIDVSSNLVNWQAVETILATNTTMGFVDTNAPSSSRRFYRAVALP